MRKRVQYKSDLPSMTQQAMKQECDINSILEKYRKTGMISHVRNSQGHYGDFSTLQDFKSNLDMIQDANAQFQALPAHLRKRFQNDPTQLVEFVMDPSNLEEAIKLGLVEKKPETQSPQINDQTTKTETQTTPAT